MTDSDALLRAVCEHPDEDVPRLVFADWLEENGEAARAEFIRDQCSNPRKTYYLDNVPHLNANRGVFESKWGAVPYAGSKGMLEVFRSVLPPPSSTSRFDVEVRRGFPDALALLWPDFLRVHRSLIWHAGATDECPKCEGKGGEEKYLEDDPANKLMHGSHWYSCHDCVNGRIPRPFPPTAQPVRRVRLTTWPPIDNPERDGSFSVNGFGRFNATPPNQWHCGEWPSVVFEMPTAEPFAALNAATGQMVRVAVNAVAEAGRAMLPAIRTLGESFVAAWPRDADGNLVEFVDTTETTETEDLAAT